MARILRYALLVVGGFTAGLVLAAPTVETYSNFATGFGSGTVLDSELVAAAAAAIVAVLVATWIRRRSTTAAVIAAGAVLVGGIASPGAWPFDLYLAVTGAGLILGGLAASTTRSSLPHLRAQTALTAGTVAGLQLAEPLRNYRQLSLSPRQYVSFMVASSGVTNLVWLALAGITGLLATAVYCIRSESVPKLQRDPHGRDLVVGIGLPVVAVGLFWSLHQALGTRAEAPENGLWLLGVLVVPIAVTAALWLPGRRGMIVLAAIAVIAVSHPEDSPWRPTDPPWLLVPVLLTAAGVWAGRRWPHTLLGPSMLALVAISAAFTAPPWDNLHGATLTLLFPLATGYIFTSTLPSSAPVTTTALALPATMSVPLTMQLGWASYIPVTDLDPGWADRNYSGIAAAVSTAAVLVCGASMAWLRHRRPHTP